VTLSVSEWLPREAFTEEAVRPVLDRALLAWSERWFVQARAAIIAVQSGSEKPRVAQSLQIKGDTSQAELSGRGKRVLLEAALGIDLSGLTLTECDHRVLDEFALAAVKDLLTALDALAQGGDGPSLCVTLGFDGREMVSVVLPANALIPAMKVAMNGVRGCDAPLKSRIEGLKPSKLIVQGLLGTAEVGLNDLRDLAIGDVVVLDNSLKSLIELKLSDNGQCIGRGRLVRTKDQISIQF
jgi:flagellar motor switch/type III secretory pathway protein FliN